MNQTVPHRNLHGTIESNGLLDGLAYHQQERKDCMWTEPGLKITRLRLVSDPGFPVWDVSYCHGVLPDGTLVAVGLPFSQLPKRGRAAFIVQHAIRDGVYAKGCGILDNISTLN
jgi:hypothetical protein